MKSEGKGGKERRGDRKEREKGISVVGDISKKEYSFGQRIACPQLWGRRA